MIERTWLTRAELDVLDAALLTYDDQLSRIVKRATTDDARNDAKWRRHVALALRDQVLGR
jgi:hypothetical protein